jgi:acyl dehydratase
VPSLAAQALTLSGDAPLDEVRMVALVPMGDTLHYIAYVDPTAEKKARNQPS